MMMGSATFARRYRGLKELFGNFLLAMASGILMVFAVLVLMAWQFQIYASKLAQGNETTWVLQIRVAPFWYFVDAVVWCAAAVQAIVCARDLALLRDGPGRPPSQPA